jgi:hypothetical protein
MDLKTFLGLLPQEWEFARLANKKIAYEKSYSPKETSCSEFGKIIWNW